MYNRKKGDDLMLNQQTWKIMFSRKLEMIMDQLGYTQTRLSKETGIPQPYISRYVKGVSTPSATVVVIISQKLGLDYETLFFPEHQDIVFYDDYDPSEKDELEWVKDFAHQLRCKFARPNEACATKDNSLQKRTSYLERQLWIAKECGMSQGYLSQFLKGYTFPSAYTAYRIVSAMGYQDKLNDLFDTCTVYYSR